MHGPEGLAEEEQLHTYGHRGGVPEAPENSLQALEQAAQRGYDGVEVDVSRCRDGLVLFHDRELEGRAIGHWSLAELPAHVPRLADAVDLLATTRLIANLELKLRDPEDLVLLDQSLEIAAPLRGRMLISSFHPKLLRRCAELAPSVPRGLAWAPDLPWLLRRPQTWRWSRATGLHARHDGIDQALVARARRLGMAVTAWTAGPEHFERLEALGVAAVITDDLRPPLRR